MAAKQGPNARHVVQNSGGWDVKKPGATRSSAQADTQREATQRATQIVRNSGCEVRVHGRDGKIRDSTTVAPPANDPFPPKG